MKRDRVTVEAMCLREKIVRSMRDLLVYLGEDPDREGLKDTPTRFVDALCEMTHGYTVDLEDVLNRTFDANGYDEIVVVSPILYHSLCEHHILPFSGFVRVAYIPSNRVVGLSKIPRLVDAVARRLQIQERMTTEIATVFEKVVQPRAVAVVVEGQHSCMSNRGARCSSGIMKTSVVRGLFKEDARARDEAFRLMGVGG